MQFRAHVGPEYSWSELQRFISGGDGHFVSGIYEFRGPHIRDAFQARLESGGSLKLVVDNSTFAKVRNPEEGEEFEARAVFEEWTNSYGNRFRYVTAPEGSRGLIANAYHIKVTVQPTDSTFWLSSGNWKLTSSQPIITQDQLDNAVEADLPGNREWHVVGQSPTLAARLRAHLEQDFARSRELGEGKHAEETFVDISSELESVVLERPAPSRVLAPLVTARRQFKVRYLLTPDREGAVFSRSVIDLIETAERQLLFQIPYIGMPPSPTTDRGIIDDLIKALTRKLRTLEDARVLLRSGGRNLSDPRHAAWWFKSKGVDINARLRVIDNHHTKGMIVDGQKVLVGSHNWSAAGVTLNRDASLIFDDREIASYFAEAFEIDWERSSPLRPRKHEKESVWLANPGSPVAPGFRRIGLSELEG